MLVVRCAIFRCAGKLKLKIYCRITTKEMPAKRPMHNCWQTARKKSTCCKKTRDFGVSLYYLILIPNLLASITGPCGINEYAVHPEYQSFAGYTPSFAWVCRLP